MVKVDRPVGRVRERGPSPRRRRSIGLCLVGGAVTALIVLCTSVASAHADGDPASDILASNTLPFHDVFLPTEPVSPEQYAKFLGAELIGLYKERLLVVMPAGFGLFRGGQSTTGAAIVLQPITIAAGPDGLAQAAIEAVKRLDDTEPPSAKAQPGPARLGETRYTCGPSLQDRRQQRLRPREDKAPPRPREGRVVLVPDQTDPERKARRDQMDGAKGHGGRPPLVLRRRNRPR